MYCSATTELGLSSGIVTMNRGISTWITLGVNTTHIVDKKLAILGKKSFGSLG